MNGEHDEKRTWRKKITLAAITGAAAGAVRALLSWALDLMP
ncbi:hypothetical protein [Phytohabitans rumicis]|uniref:Uncharacterized protein n=1 Tax=Phytohabitans rumicis TaxID=1076125 RepID=A0A6V8L7P9_9ACTN|nr:hypothetical protein [Phytohabitans rumicis]GFJ93282.1 hypothetical protein Prum_069240 [Phytohabitans rumicis]